MLRLNKLTDYAVVILVHMAHHPATRHSAASVAAATGLTETTVAKILKDLGKACLVCSTRGATGGYALARPTETLTIRSVIEAIEGPVTMTDCVEGATGCCPSLHCMVRGNWDKVNEAVIAALDAVTLKDMMPQPMLYDVVKTA